MHWGYFAPKKCHQGPTFINNLVNFGHLDNFATILRLFLARASKKRLQETLTHIIEGKQFGTFHRAQNWRSQKWRLKNYGNVQGLLLSAETRNGVTALIWFVIFVSKTVRESSNINPILGFFSMSFMHVAQVLTSLNIQLHFLTGKQQYKSHPWFLFHVIHVCCSSLDKLEHPVEFPHWKAWNGFFSDIFLAIWNDFWKPLF